MMVDNKSYELLKMLYKSSSMSKDEINRKTGHKEQKRTNPIISSLLVDKLIRMSNVDGEPDGEGGFLDGVVYYSITIAGRAYVEQRKRDGRNFWVPYIITTMLALLSLITSLADRWEVILQLFSSCNPCT